MKDVCWIEGNPSTRLAIVMRPRGHDWLETELTRFRRSGIDIVVSLLESEEAKWLGLADEARLSEEAGMRFLSYPIPDVHVPQDAAAFRKFVANLADELRAGRAIGVHCRGSIGRATVTAACALIHLGWEASTALSAVAATRGCNVPDTEEQRQWVMAYKAEL